MSDQRRVGPYRILEHLGGGCTGGPEFYLAEQTEPIRRTVMLAIIRRSKRSERYVAGFESALEVSPMMNHPCIAKFYDAGSTPGGRLYFAMEYVKGTPITRYCDEHKLPVPERLNLFIQLCEGVQHAHQKAIIHRDLNPSNVLVTTRDDEPIPKIMYFGVANAMAQKLTGDTVYTELFGIPEYMSPEQTDVTGEDIDTRADVYALGVILYELLVGASLFDPFELRKAGFEGIVRMIREQDPPRPSTKVGTLGERGTEVANARHTTLAKLRKQLRGKLDRIAMKAIEKDRTRRYESAAALASAVRGHLHHDSVFARSLALLQRIR